MTALSHEELIDTRRRIVASMSREDQKALMSQVTEQADKRLNDEYIRQQTKLYKQTDRYKEYEKRKLAELDNETKTTEKQTQ